MELQGSRCPSNSASAATSTISLLSGITTSLSKRGFRSQQREAGPRSSVPGDIATSRKILNVEKSRLDKALANKEIQALITALGTGIGDSFNLDKLRYGRILIMTDADIDGSHIRTLLLTFFFRYLEPLIANGNLYIAQPPLYLIKAAKDEYYVYSDDEKDRTLKRLDGKKTVLQRYKGLGEMNPEQLWETTMNPEKRTLLQVPVEYAAAADRTFDMLMGTAVPPRKRFIQTHAKQVRNLDV